MLGTAAQSLTAAGPSSCRHTAAVSMWLSQVLVEVQLVASP